MAKLFDLIVVGGGPAGLEAARTAAQFGLKVALVERKTHPALVLRSCAQMFLMNMDSFYNESMYPAPQQERWVFPANNFSVPYSGAYREFFACHFVSPMPAVVLKLAIMSVTRPVPECPRWCLTKVPCCRDSLMNACMPGSFSIPVAMWCMLYGILAGLR